MILLKAKAKNFDLVLKHRKHATEGRPRNVKNGEIVLLARLRADLHGQKPITHTAIYRCTREDKRGETAAIWDELRRYVIDLDCVRELEKALDLRDVSARNYEQVQTCTKIDENDAEKILDGRCLKPRDK
jgi:5-methylcytosine-specific restriction protein A